MSYNYEDSIWGRGLATKKWTDPSNVRLRRALRAFSGLKSGAKILDIGCGAGVFIRSIKHERGDWECYGADISRTAIAEAQKAGDGVRYACFDGRMPYADNEFDAVMFTDVLEHVEDPDSFMKECARVLKPGGVLFAYVPCEGDATSLWHLLDNIGVKKGLTKKFAGHINFFSRAEVLHLFIKNSLTIIDRSYSEHALGQLLGVAVFFAMERQSKKSSLRQINNESFFAESVRHRGVLRKAVNWLVTAESELFKRVPSPNLYLVARKV